jgi:iron complex outermembrane receptor protein
MTHHDPKPRYRYAGRLIAGAAVAAAIAGGPGHAQDKGRAADTTTTLPDTLVTASRLSENTVATATTIIDARQIEQSAAETIPDLLSRFAGIQTFDLFKGNAGSFARIDIRGFGATGTQNTLILLDGRRLNDIDLAAVDLAEIPVDEIARIEIIRGNGAAVLYGDGAVGGAINIVTKGAVAKGFSGGVRGGYGSYEYWDGSGTARFANDDMALSVTATQIESDGYRDNNDFREQALFADAKLFHERGEAYLRFNADNQEQGLPGARTQTQVISDPKGASTPFDFADSDGVALTVGTTYELSDAWELVVDGRFASKEQFARLISAFGPAFNSTVDTRLDSFAFTPRMLWEDALFGRPASMVTGIDFHFSDYDSDRSRNEADAAIHHYTGEQYSVAAYGKVTSDLNDQFKLSVGGRLQQISAEASDRFNAAAPGASLFDAQQSAIDDDEVEWAADLGLEYLVNDAFTAFARAGRSFRVPTMDERIKPFTGADMNLNTQTSYDVEAGGRYEWATASLQASAFWMEVDDEIHFDPTTFTNINYDPTRRQGLEASLFWQPRDDLRLQASAAYIRARFREGPFSGNEVPLVAPITGSVSGTWQAHELVAVSAAVNYVGEKRMDNDEANFQPEIDSYYLVDLGLSGTYRSVKWSARVNNLLDEDYYSYAVASATTFGVFNAYPLPGRTFRLQLGLTF